MKYLTLLILIFSMIGCKEKCADCHIHDSSGSATQNIEVCGRGDDYSEAVKEKTAAGYECHEIHH